MADSINRESPLEGGTTPLLLELLRHLSAYSAKEINTFVTFVQVFCAGIPWCTPPDPNFQ